MASCPKPGAFPCGQCLVCRINQKRVLTARICLEAQCHQENTFATFTYAQEPSSGSLEKRHLSSTVHRLREAMRYRGLRPARFFGVGEYGDQTARPHYHAALFGVGEALRVLVQQCWDGVPGAGYVDFGRVEPQSAAYIAGYVTKKHADPEFVAAGMQPQFSLMSRRPGVGSLWLPFFVEALESPDGVRYMVEYQDVPTAIQCGSRSLPLGPYLRQKLRFYFYGDTCKPRGAADLAGLKHHVEVLAQLPPLQVHSTVLDQITAWTQAQQSVKEIQQARKAQRALQVSKRHKIFRQLRTL